MVKSYNSGVAAVLICLLHSSASHAIGLIQAYDEALRNDPAYRAAIYEHEAGQQYKIIGRNGLLPNLSANYSNSKNQADITSPNAYGQSTTSQQSYYSTVRALQLRIPVINLDGLARYRQGIAQTDYSNAQFSLHRQDLIIRLVGAYANAKYSEDSLVLAIAKRDTYAEQRRMNERMFDKGEGTKTDMFETESKFDLSEAELIEAQDGVTDSRNQLAAILGQSVTALDGFREGFQVKPMAPASFDEWKTIALAHNPDVISQRDAVEAARQEIEKNRAGHAPRLDVIASVSNNISEVIYTLNQQIKTTSLGVQLTVPLYSGGYVNAMTSQATSNFEKAKADRDTKINQVLVDLRKNFDLSVSSSSRIDALVKTVGSSELLVKATRKSIQGGLRTNLDVLNAQQQLFTAKRDLSLARYNYLLYYLRLRQAAGVLNESDLKEIAGYFMPG